MGANIPVINRNYNNFAIESIRTEEEQKCISSKLDHYKFLITVNDELLNSESQKYAKLAKAIKILNDSNYIDIPEEMLEDLKKT